MKITLSVIKADIGSVGRAVIHRRTRLPMSELEYTGIMEKLKVLDTRFRLRHD